MGVNREELEGRKEEVRRLGVYNSSLLTSHSSLKIYLDTSVISHLDQQDAPERMAETHKLWDVFKTGKYEVVISDIALGEIDGCEEKKRNTLYEYMRQIQYSTVVSDDRSVDIASRFVQLNILKQKSFDDCQHIANAIVSDCDIIVSWNFKHIVNHKTIMGVKAVAALEGFNELLVYDPSVLLGGEENDT